MKMINILRNYKKYIYNTFTVNPFQKIIGSSNSEHYLIIPNSMTIHRKEFTKVLDRYYISELFELSNCFLGTRNEPYMFLHLVDHPISIFKIAEFVLPAHIYRDDIYVSDSSKICPPKEYAKKFLNYLKSLDKWVKTNKCPENIKMQCQYRSLPYNEFNREIFYSKFYLPRNDKLRFLLKTEKITELKELAEVYDVYVLSKNDKESEIVWSLNTNSIPKYPYYPEKEAIPYTPTTVKLHKNDILCVDKKFFLINKESSFALFAPPQSKVIRPNSKISPEYLYIYLSGDLAWRIRNVLIIQSGDNMTAESVSLNEFPIILPKESDNKFKDLFNKISSPDVKYYEMYNSLPEKNVSEVLEMESFTKIKLNNKNLLKRQIRKDLMELNECYEAKAYKAAIVLAGAILEAFLIDWLSELDGKNYVEDFSKLRKKIKPTLDNYIKEINKSIPEWDEYQKKADSIRQKRNTIHTLSSLKFSDEFNENTCLETIEELKQVLFSR